MQKIDKGLDKKIQQLYCSDILHSGIEIKGR